MASQRGRSCGADRSCRPGLTRSSTGWRGARQSPRQVLGPPLADPTRWAADQNLCPWRPGAPLYPQHQRRSPPLSLVPSPLLGQAWTLCPRGGAGWGRQWVTALREGRREEGAVQDGVPAPGVGLGGPRFGGSVRPGEREETRRWMQELNGRGWWVLACHPGTREAEAGGQRELGAAVQPTPRSETPSQKSTSGNGRGRGRAAPGLRDLMSPRPASPAPLRLRRGHEMEMDGGEARGPGRSRLSRPARKVWAWRCT